MIALTREVPAAIHSCELTYVERLPIDLDAARAQHLAYERALARAGCRVRRLPPLDALADSVFVEDTAIVFTEVAVITRPGAASRRPETDSVAAALREFRELVCIGEPGTIDGGDVLVNGRNVWVGLSQRTNAAGIMQLRDVLRPHGYEVQAVETHGCLHLKSAVTFAREDIAVLNPAWVDRTLFRASDVIDVHRDEPFGANVLRIQQSVFCSAAFARTNDLIESRGVALERLDLSELEKAEGAVTCCSLIISS